MKMRAAACLVGLLTAAYYIGETDSAGREPAGIKQIPAKECAYIGQIRQVASPALDSLLLSQGHVMRVREFEQACAHSGEYPAKTMLDFAQKELERNAQVAASVQARLKRDKGERDFAAAEKSRRRLKKLDLTRQAIEVFRDSIKDKRNQDSRYRALSALIVEQHIYLLRAVGDQKQTRELTGSYLRLVEDSPLKGPACSIIDKKGCVGESQAEIELDTSVLDESLPPKTVSDKGVSK